MNGVFRDIVMNMGVIPTSLQNEKGRYQFSEKSCSFWEKVLSQYTIPPYCDVRRCNYTTIPIQFIIEFEVMVVNTMKNAHKPDDEIRITLMKIDAITQLCQRIYSEKFREQCENLISQYWENLNIYSHLLSIDRATISSYINKNLLPIHIKEILDKEIDLAEYFDNERLNEVHSLDDFIEPTLLESILNDDQSEQLIDGSDSEHKFISPEELNLLIQSKSGAEICKDVQRFYEAMEKCDEDDKDSEATTMAAISKKNRNLTELNKAAEKLQRNSDKELGFSAEDRYRSQSVNRRPSQKILEEALCEQSSPRYRFAPTHDNLEDVLKRMLDKAQKEYPRRSLIELFREAAQEFAYESWQEVFAATSLEELARKIKADEDDKIADIIGDV